MTGVITHLGILIGQMLRNRKVPLFWFSLFSILLPGISFSLNGFLLFMVAVLLVSMYRNIRAGSQMAWFYPGHGIPAALFASLVRYSFQTYRPFMKDPSGLLE